MHRLRYNGATRSYVKAAGSDTVMPGGAIGVAPDLKLINGSPFGPYDDSKPIIPEGKKGTVKSKTKRLANLGWKDTKSKHAHQNW